MSLHQGNTRSGQSDLHEQGFAHEFHGPVVADLAEASSPAIAQLDARWAAAFLAGGAHDAAELRGLLEMAGLLDVPPYWMGGVL